jgi:Tfp pilus assembly protein PilO
MSRDDIWRQRLWIWLPALLFFLANGIAFSVYKFGYAGRMQSLDAQLAAQVAQEKDVAGERRKLEDRLRQVQVTKEAVRRLYADRFSTRRRRLTGITAEVKQLARKAGLDPRSITYPEETIQEYGLVKRSFIFSVEGTYLDLRKFINLLELTDSFLTLEDVTLTDVGEEGPELRMNLTLSTLFAKEPERPAAAGAAAPPRPARGAS